MNLSTLLWWRKPPEKFPFTAAMMCRAIRNERWVSYVLGFERKLMCKGEKGTVRVQVPFDIRPSKLVIAEETGPFFVIDSIRVGQHEQFAVSSISAAAFDSEAAYCDFDTAHANEFISIGMTCVGRATLIRRAQAFIRRCYWRLRYRLADVFRKREVLGPYTPDDEDDEDDENEEENES